MKDYQRIVQTDKVPDKALSEIFQKLLDPDYRAYDLTTEEEWYKK